MLGRASTRRGRRACARWRRDAAAASCLIGLRRVRGVSRPVQDVPLLRRPRPAGGSREQPWRPSRPSCRARPRAAPRVIAASISQTSLRTCCSARKNPTFREPEGWLPRLLHSLAHNLIFLPYALRNDAGSRFAADGTQRRDPRAARARVVLPASTGLMPMAGTPVMSWLVAMITVSLAVTSGCARRVRPSRRQPQRRSAGSRRWRCSSWAALAILRRRSRSCAVNGVRSVARAAVSHRIRGSC